MKLTITIEGDTEQDLMEPLGIIERQVSEGYTSGFDRNESARYDYAVEK